MYEPLCVLKHKTAGCRAASYPEHLVEVVILLSRGVEQEGLQEEPGVHPQPQHLQAQDAQSDPHPCGRFFLFSSWNLLMSKTHLITKAELIY